MIYNALSIHGGTWDNHLFLHSNSDVSSSASLHMDFHTLERLNIIWPHIEKFHSWWEILKDVHFGMGSDQLPLWWYDFHFLIFIFYDDEFLLLLMFGRMQIRPWNPGILWNDIFPKGVATYGSLQTMQWDPRILLNYLN